MDKFTEGGYSEPAEIVLSIYDSDVIYYGGSQNWFLCKTHQVSGCGPVAAANITAYLSGAFPDKYRSLYPGAGALNKRDFIEHMIEVRKFVKPGIFGLTSVHQFSDNVLSFAKGRDVTLIPHILSEGNESMEEAVEFISDALFQKIPIAILVLKHSVKELDDYTWHWMTITHLKMKPDDSKFYISVSTYGERHEIDFDLLWNHRGQKNKIKMIYFT